MAVIKNVIFKAITYLRVTMVAQQFQEIMSQKKYYL